MALNKLRGEKISDIIYNSTPASWNQGWRMINVKQLGSGVLSGGLNGGKQIAAMGKYIPIHWFDFDMERDYALWMDYA